MIRLRLLGTIELRSDDAHELRSVVVQPKRLALLAYLAAAPRTEHRRDTLLGVFWPDLDAEHARGALSKALHYIRRSLGPDVILGFGEETLRVNPDRLWCDAAAFEDAIGAGLLENALELYSGDFLEGFYLSDVEEFERWVEERRNRLRGRAAEAARSLSRRREEAGSTAGAVEYARRALALAGDDESDLRRLVRLLDATGDRAGALHAYEEFRRRIEREYHIAPSPKTESLIAAIRSAEPAGSPSGDAIERHLPVEAPVPTPGAKRAEIQTPVPAAEISRNVIRRRSLFRPALVAALALVLPGAVAAAFLLALKGGAHDLDPQRVVIAPLLNRTGDERLDPLGAMAADWIIEGLAQSRIAGVVPFGASVSSARRVAEEDGPEAAALPKALARETRAGIVVTGSYYQQGDTILLTAQISRGVDGAVLGAVEAVPTLAHDPVGAFDELRSRVLAGLGPHVNPRLREHAAILGRTPSFEAYREYAAGVERMNNRGDSDWRSALAHFERAAALDTSYMLPRVRAAELYARVNFHARADSIARLVEPHVGSLAEYDRLVLTIVAARARGRHHISYNAALRGSDVAPNTILHFELARELMTQHRPRAALRVFSAMDPHHGELRGFAQYWVKRTEAHHLVGDYRGELRAARAARALMPDVANMVRLEHRALVGLGRVGEAQQLLDDFMVGAGAGHPHAGAVMLAMAAELRTHGYTDLAREVTERSVEWHLARTPRNPPLLADALYEAGRWAEAAETIREAAGNDPGIPALGRLGTIAARLGDTDEAARIDRQLAELRTPYLLGLNTAWRARIAAVLGDGDKAVDLLRSAYREGRDWRLDLHYEQDFEPLRGHPGFQALLRPRG